MNNQLLTVIKENGLEQVEGQSIVEKFGNYETIAKEWEEKAKMIVVTDETQIREMAMAKEARKKFSDLRIDVEKTRKAMKEQSLRKGQAIDAVAKFLTSLIAPIEEHLRKQEDFIKIKAAEKAEAIRLEEARVAEEARIAKEKEEAEERERLRVENEKLKKEAAIKEKALSEEKEKLAKLEKQNKEREDAEKQKMLKMVQVANVTPNPLLDEIKTNYVSSKEFATEIMNGDAEYDGADGAREVLKLCSYIEYLLSILEVKEVEK